ncbi:MAG: SDR family oxidoreductase [Marivivens sp.]|nr:SDR family oxidoreductase [Marivivens sp.]
MAIAIVTGGGTGIGAATAEALDKVGHDVVAIGLDRSGELPDHIRFEQMDLTDTSAINGLFSQFSEISALVNCAGILMHKQEWEPENFSKVLDINLTTTLKCSNAAKDGLAKARGAIVNVASMWSYFGSAGSPAYATSKAGVVALTRSCAVAWAPLGIRVNAVAPGWIETRLSANARNDQERVSKINARIPMSRWGTTAEIASVISFLTSQDAAYITGALLPIDGGYSIA